MIVGAAVHHVLHVRALDRGCCGSVRGRRRLPIMEDGQVSKTGSCIQVSGGVGPDGIEMAADNGLYVCHLNVGVWLFDAHMLPTHLIYSADRARHDHITNVALGGADLKTACMTEAMSGDVLMARVPVAGKKLFGLS